MECTFKTTAAEIWTTLLILCDLLKIEMARSKIFQARTAHNPQHSAH